MYANLSLFPEDEPAVVAAGVDGPAAGRCYFDPSAFGDVVGMDFGSGKAHFYSAGSGRSWKCAADDAGEEILRLPEGTALIAEWAHLAVPRTQKSLAQPFSALELVDLYGKAKASGITIKLFPHYHSGTRARKWAANHFPEAQLDKKTDAADAIALALYVTNCNAVSLANPPTSFCRCPKRDYGKAVRGYSTISLNAERTTNYIGKYFPNVIHLGDEIFSRRGKRIGRSACYSIASLIATEVDSLPVMFVRGSRPPGVHFWCRYVLMMSPHHHDAGIARSNLMRHSFRPFLKRFGRKRGVNMGVGAKTLPFADHNELQAATRTAAMRQFRNTIKDCYRVGVEAAIRNRFSEFDPCETAWKESRHGR